MKKLIHRKVKWLSQGQLELELYSRLPDSQFSPAEEEDRAMPRVHMWPQGVRKKRCPSSLSGESWARSEEAGLSLRAQGSEEKLDGKNEGQLSETAAVKSVALDCYYVLEK